MYLHHFFELMNDPTVSETFYLEYLALHQYLGEVSRSSSHTYNTILYYTCIHTFLAASICMYVC